MKLPFIFASALAVGGSTFAQSSPSPPLDYSKSTAREMRRAFHQQGFKTDLSDFNFTVPKEMSERAGAVSTTSAGGLRPATFLNNEDLLTPAGVHAAAIVWRQNVLAFPKGFRGYSYLYNTNWYKAEADKNVWPLERDLLAGYASELDPAAGAALSGPFGFNLNASAGVAMLLPHLAGLTHFSEMFAGRTMMALRDHDSNAAWTNLLAATLMVTGWQVEPVEVSQNVRFTGLQTAYEVTWQALQADVWTDEQLAQLQREWESLDVFKPLPDTVAFMGASYVDMLRQQDDPKVAEGEKALLVFYHDREVEMRRAIQSQSWADMRQLPDMTNVFFLLPPTANLPRLVAARINFRRMPMEMSGGGVGLPGRASEAEARRRILITAIALERFRLKHGSYPRSLELLVPDWLKVPLPDFMNGESLHYWLRDDGHYLLYSVGLDGQDDGGKMYVESDDDDPMARMRGALRNPDIVWPLPAPVAVADTRAVEEGKRLQQRLDAVSQGITQQQAEAEAARRTAAKELLSDPRYKKATFFGLGGKVKQRELIYKGQPLTKFLHNEKSSGTKLLSLDALFTLKPVITGDEPEVVTYQVPISYDSISNIPGMELCLVMDSPTNNEYQNQPKLEECTRASNGDCLLAWNAACEGLGMHAMQALLMFPGGDDDDTIAVKGPALPFLSTNLFRFDAYSALFSDRGAGLYAELAESNATYRIEIKRDATKPPIKTFTGSTTNGAINLEWDLHDDHGDAFTNNSFQSYFTVTLPSGRTQTMSQRQNKIGTRGD